MVGFVLCILCLTVSKTCPGIKDILLPLLIKKVNCSSAMLTRIMGKEKVPSPGEIANLLQEISENELDGGELSCYDLDSNEDIRLSESNCEEFEESADIIDKNPVNPDIYIATDGTEWILHNGNIPG
ncbi:hypothetical protein TNCV_4064971 [Trichonephila clavipes]|uniref:Uncharacterized protein n=1 Tax=Trichonephila clavipes TaxID=2585209 RepID=A0A8X6W9I1_TRICX|nr:hypothetical protein TNCV_4064971 [Trichonephila clavipes]